MRIEKSPTAFIVILLISNVCSFLQISRLFVSVTSTSKLMAFDEFLSQKLNSIKRTFDALTERLADPDLAHDRKQMLALSRDRAGMEPTVLAFDEWNSLEKERRDLIEMEQAPDADQDIKEMSRQEQKVIETKQLQLEQDITLMLLPKDPNDDRNGNSTFEKKIIYRPCID